MLESRIIRRDPERVKAACRLRGIDRSAEVDELAALDARRGELLSAARELREQQNLLRLRFPELERTGKSSVPLQIELRLLARKTAGFEAELEELEERRRALLLLLPNFPRGRAAEPGPAAGVCLRRFPIRPKVRGPSGKDWVFSPHRPVRPQEMRRKPARKIRVFLPSRTACPLCSE